MTFLSSLFSTLFLLIILDCFVPIHTYFVNPYPNPYGYRYGVVPAVADDLQTIYPNYRSTSNVPNSSQYAGHYLIIPINEETSEETLNDDIQGKAFGSSAFKNNLFKKLALDVTFNKEIEDPLVVKCRKDFGGTLVNNECYRYFSEEKIYEDARKFCQEDGGDLWTPDPEDAYLYQKLGYLMPEFATAGLDDLLIGAKAAMDGTVVTVNDEDISGTFLINVDDGFSVGECMALSFSHGGFVAHGQSCSNDDEFICEYPLNEPSTIGAMFNKLSDIKNKFKIWKTTE